MSESPVLEAQEFAGESVEGKTFPEPEAAVEESDGEPTAL